MSGRLMNVITGNAPWAAEGPTSHWELCAMCSAVVGGWWMVDVESQEEGRREGDREGRREEEETDM